MNLTPLANQILGGLTIIAQIGIIFLIIFLITKRPLFLRFAADKAIVLAFAVAFVAMAGSLIYSEIIGYEPCKLCWFQRIFMYPQVFILGLALIKKDRVAADYSIMLSVVGAIIAGYHYLLQRGAVPATSCSAVGYSVSCAQKFVMQYGYITIPMMALTAFVAIALLMLAYKKSVRID